MHWLFDVSQHLVAQWLSALHANLVESTDEGAQGQEIGRLISYMLVDGEHSALKN